MKNNKFLKTKLAPSCWPPFASPASPKKKTSKDIILMPDREACSHKGRNFRRIQFRDFSPNSRN